MNIKELKLNELDKWVKENCEYNWGKTSKTLVYNLNELTIILERENKKSPTNSITISNDPESTYFGSIRIYEFFWLSNFSDKNASNVIEAFTKYYNAINKNKELQAELTINNTATKATTKNKKI